MHPLMTDVCVCVLEELTGSFNVEGCAAGFTCAGQPAADLRAAAPAAGVFRCRCDLLMSRFCQ